VYVPVHDKIRSEGFAVAANISRRSGGAFNVWAGIVGKCRVRSLPLPHRLTDNHYRDFLLQDLPKPVEDVPLTVRARMWCMQEFAPEYFCRDVLNNAGHDRWIGRGGSTAWPPRPPELNPLDFYLWEHDSIINEEIQHHRTADTCQTVRNCPGISARNRRSVMRRVKACTESHGGNLERFSQMCSLSYISQIKCFRTHADMHILLFWHVELVPEICLSRFLNAAAWVRA
jgi:hypothetical protein